MTARPASQPPVPHPSDARLTTARLTLRPPVPADAGPLAAQSSDLRVARMVSRIPHPNTPEIVAGFIDAARAAAIPLFVIDDGAPRGMIGIEDGELGYWLAPAVWGRGYATEAARALLAFAFDRLALAQVRAGVFGDNAASARVLAKLGFRPAGRSRAYSAGRGAEVDQIDLTLSATDWRAAA